MKLAVVYRSEV